MGVLEKGGVLPKGQIEINPSKPQVTSCHEGIYLKVGSWKYVRGIDFLY